MQIKAAPSWTTVLLLGLIAFVSLKGYEADKALEASLEAAKARIAVLEQAALVEAGATVEIHVERAYDADMGVYDYQLCGEAALPIKRSRKRMSQLRLSGKETF